MWQQLATTVDESSAEPLADFLSGLGALSVSFEDAGDQPLFEPKPGETPVWEKTRIIALFDAEADVSGVRRTLEREFPGRLAGWDCHRVEDQVWERVWMDHFEPMRFGRRLWVCPSGHEPPQPEAVNVRLDPGLAFGTGTHPTTALCLAWLDGLDLEGRTVVDYGCGSGILAIAALKLGAAMAYGVDIDPQALIASRDNAARNGVEDRFVLGYPEALAVAPADVLLANILAGALIELAPEITARIRPGGLLALSGILATQVDTVRLAYASRITFAPTVFQEDWALLTGVRYTA